MSQRTRAVPETPVVDAARTNCLHGQSHEIVDGPVRADQGSVVTVGSNEGGT